MMANLDEAVSVVLAYLRLAACQGRSSPSTAAESMRSPLRTSPPLSLSSPSRTLSLSRSLIHRSHYCSPNWIVAEWRLSSHHLRLSCHLYFIFPYFRRPRVPARAAEKTDPGTRLRFGSAPYRLFFFSWTFFTTVPSAYGTEIEFDTVGVIQTEFAEDLYRSQSPFWKTGIKQICTNHNTRRNFNKINIESSFSKPSKSRWTFWLHPIVH